MISDGRTAGVGTGPEGAFIWSKSAPILNRIPVTPKNPPPKIPSQSDRMGVCVMAKGSLSLRWNKLRTGSFRNWPAGLSCAAGQVAAHVGQTRFGLLKGPTTIVRDRDSAPHSQIDWRHTCRYSVRADPQTRPDADRPPVWQEGPWAPFSANAARHQSAIRTGSGINSSAMPPAKPRNAGRFKPFTPQPPRGRLRAQSRSIRLTPYLRLPACRTC